jgi:CelD/BcsL family acetyltransferase involved in cellulose biosynthesis
VAAALMTTSGSTEVDEVIDPRTDPRWAAFVDEARGSVFHHPEWLRLLHRTYGYEIAACCVADAAGRIRAGLPLARVTSPITGRRLVALPFSDVCEPLVSPEHPTARARLLEAVAALGGRMGLDVEVRAAVDDLPGAHRSGGFLHHRLALGEDAAYIERRVISSSARRGVAKARRSGLVAERDRGAAALGEFYRLHLRTRRRQGMPIQPRRFILGLDALFEQGLGCVVLVRDPERVIAAAVFLSCNGVLTYKYGASDERHLAARPNNLLFMEAIAWGCAAGHEALDFGRTDLDNPGLAAVKRGWGAEERPLWYTTTAEPAASMSDGVRARLLQGAIRHGPAGLSRLTGELLYKHLG